MIKFHFLFGNKLSLVFFFFFFNLLTHTSGQNRATRNKAMHMQSASLPERYLENKMEIVSSINDISKTRYSPAKNKTEPLS